MNTKSISSFAAVAVALALLVGPFAVSSVSASDSFEQSIRQSIEQSQESEQDSQVVSGGSTFASGNNFNTQEQTNEGSQTAAQDSDDE